MREYLHVGDKIVTLTGYEEIVHIHDGVSETDSYEVGMDGDSTKVVGRWPLAGRRCGCDKHSVNKQGRIKGCRDPGSFFLFCRQQDGVAAAEGA